MGSDIPSPRQGECKPKRIQLRRSKGWRKPEGAVVVSRPGKWGNPFMVTEDRSVAECISAFRIALMSGLPLVCAIADVRRELRGKDLACWCKVGEPCHADVLLEIANAG